MAEPWNTVTGLSYIVVGAVAIPYYYRLGRAHKVDLSIYLYGLAVEWFVGIATTTFHATLQYEHQLLDKISMHALVSGGFITMYTRCDPSFVFLHRLSRAQSLILGIAFWCTRNDRDSMIHQGVRTVWLITFAGQFFYILFTGAVMSRQCGKQIERLYNQCYTIWMISLVGWLMDNLLCDLLQQERFYIPYINYHGTFWHLGMSLL